MNIFTATTTRTAARSRRPGRIGPGTANADIEVVVWPDSHHHVFLQDPAAAEAAIEDWLSRSVLD
jgi:hypothetical protein